MKGMERRLVLLLLVLSLAVLSGCAGTVPTAEFKKPMTDTYRLCLNDTATVKLAAADGVALADFSRQRLESRLLQSINEKKKIAPCRSANERAFVLNSKITQYDEGNAFARAMLAGLGQIHLAGDFVLSLMPSENEPVAEFAVKKTFAWGGMYGAITRMEDVEPAFTDAVAEAIVSLP